MNTWPDGQRHAMSQTEHEQWNRTHAPGTRQCCDRCGEFTGRCEDDSLYSESGKGPLCEDCYKETVPLSDIRIAILRNGATSEMDAVLDELERLRDHIKHSQCEVTCTPHHPCGRCRLMGMGRVD